MDVIPRILLQKGHCVTLGRGRLSEPSVWHVDPVEIACRFASEGASWIQVTDLDAIAGTGSNADLVREIIRKAGVPIQVGGGIRSLEAVHHWVDAGAGRVVLGTAALQVPGLAAQAAHAHPDQVAVAVDVWRGKVMVHGWTEPTVYEPVDYVKSFGRAPLAAFVVTDIDSEVEGPLASFAMVTRVAEATGVPVIASGMVRTRDDISTLKYIYNIAGVMISKPLFDRSLSLADAIATAAATAEPVAEFQ